MTPEHERDLDFEQLGRVLGEELGVSHDEARLSRQRRRFLALEKRPASPSRPWLMLLGSAALAAVALVVFVRSGEPHSAAESELEGLDASGRLPGLRAGQVVRGDGSQQAFIAAGGTQVVVHDGAVLRAGEPGEGCLELQGGRVDLAKTSPGDPPCTLTVGPYRIDMARARANFELFPERQLARVDVTWGVLELRLGESDEVMLLRAGDVVELEHQFGPVPEPQPDAHIDPKRVADGAKREPKTSEVGDPADVSRTRAPANDTPRSYEPPVP